MQRSEVGAPGWRRTPIEELPWAVLIRVALCRGVLTIFLTLLVAAFVPRLFGASGTTIVTGSMMPVIHPGDVALTWPLEPDEYGLGQVILFPNPARPDQQVMHRIVDITDDGFFITKGDANREADSTPLDPATVIGVGRILVPSIGKPIVWAVDGELLLVAATIVLAVLVMRGCLAVEDFPRIRKSGGALVAVEAGGVIVVVAVAAFLVSDGVVRSSSAVFAGGTSTGSSTWATAMGPTTCEVDWEYTLFPPDANAHFRVRNHGTVEIPGGWRLTFQFVDDQRVTGAGNGAVSQEEGSPNVTFVSDTWTTIWPDGFVDAQISVTSVSGEFADPVDFRLNGSPCEFVAGGLDRPAYLIPPAPEPEPFPSPSRHPNHSPSRRPNRTRADAEPEPEPVPLPEPQLSPEPEPEPEPESLPEPRPAAVDSPWRPLPGDSAVV